MSPTVIEKNNSLNQLKKADLQTLLTKHFDSEWRKDASLKLYAYVLDGKNAVTEEEPCEPTEELPEFVV